MLVSAVIVSVLPEDRFGVVGSGIRVVDAEEFRWQIYDFVFRSIIIGLLCGGSQLFRCEIMVKDVPLPDAILDNPLD